MNIEEYISSGILDSYVLGLTTKQETAEVERLAKQYPAVKTEIETIQSTLETYAYAHAQTPPKGLEDKIWAKIQKEDKADSSNTSTTSEKNIHTLPFEKTEKRASNFSVLRVAASLLLASSILGNLYLFNRWKNTKEELLVALTQNKTIAQEANYVKEENLAINKEMEMATDPAFKMVRLAGQKIAPTSKILLAWNQSTKQVYVMKSQLPAVPNGKQYQLWAIIDKKPVDLGVFDANTNPIAMKNIEKAQAFAVTLENTGGSPIPTSELYVMGGT